LRTNMHFTPKNNPLKRPDLDELVGCYRPGDRHNREPTRGEQDPEGRWRAFGTEELLQRTRSTWTFSG
jgi:type I restriction enzyme M protein